MKSPLSSRSFAIITSAALTLSACGGGGGGGGVAVPTPVPLVMPAPALPANPISAASPVAPGCTGGSSSGTLYVNAEVEPFVAVHPTNPNLLISTWQQDRWSNGGSRALMTAVSVNGGGSWVSRLMPFSRCGGASAGSSGDFERASDPWVDIGPTGVMYSMALALSGTTLSAGSSSAMLVSRSVDGGLNWDPPVSLVRDGETLFNDKNSLTADPTDARYVYAVWDRLNTANFGPTLFGRSIDSGATWEAARVIYNPSVAGGVSQTIGNRIVVLPGGALINLFTQIDTVAGVSTAWLGILRSSDKGVTWSAPIRISELHAVGTKDPQTGKAIRDGASLAAIAGGPDGSLWLTWQDARFSGGLRDAIALSRSSDGGLSWTAPVAINRDSTTAAFTPSIIVSADGTVGVTHYDLRADTADASTLLSSAWLLTSRDGVSWVETRVWSPFDLARAPDARGLFLGDYQGLISSGSSFLSVLALSSQDTANRTDIYALRVTPASSTLAQPGTQALAGAMPQGLSQEAFRRARHEAITAAMEGRLPGWSKRFD